MLLTPGPESSIITHRRRSLGKTIGKGTLMATVRLGRYEVQHYDLPRLCMQCGAKATFTKTKNFAWFPGWVFLFLLLGCLHPLVLLVAILVVTLRDTKRMRIPVPLCQRHRWHFGGRVLAILGSLFAWIGCVVLVAVLGANLSSEAFTPMVALTALGGFVAWIIYAAALSLNAIRAIEITDRHIVLAGVSKEFVAALGPSILFQEEEDDYEEERCHRAHRRDDGTYTDRKPQPPRPRRDSAEDEYYKKGSPPL